MSNIVYKVYKVARYANYVEKVTIKGETSNYVVLPSGRREAKITESVCYFYTVEECKQWKINCVRKKLEEAEQTVVYLKQQITTLQGTDLRVN